MRTNRQNNPVMVACRVTVWAGYPFSRSRPATLLPAVIDAAVVLLDIIRRTKLSPSQGFTLGRFEIRSS
jgi:hypothetical protein